MLSFYSFAQLRHRYKDTDDVVATTIHRVELTCVKEVIRFVVISYSYLARGRESMAESVNQGNREVNNESYRTINGGRASLFFGSFWRRHGLFGRGSAC